jgi:hypothetical protein
MSMEKYGQPFIIAWTLSVILTLCSTVSSVFLLIAIEESSGSVETAYFLDLFDQTTLGLGTMAPLMFLYAGFICIFGGLVTVYFNQYSWTTALVGVAAIICPYGIFCIFLTTMVSALQNARQTSRYVSFHSKKISLPLAQIKNEMENCKD